MSAAPLYPHLTNASYLGDQVSSACDRTLVNDPERGDAYIDPHFGHSWGWTPKPGAALYGRTDAFPDAALERLGNGTYLRVPFRRVPYIDVHSVAELLSLAASTQSRDPAIQGVWRGQAQEYFLQRERIDNERLYGDANVREPSLLPSASRAGVSFPKIFESWSALLDLYLRARVEALASTYASNAAHIRHVTDNFRSGYNYRLWGMALAQHYGLPSTGIDLTPDIKVALFFALHRFRIDSATGSLSVVRASEDAAPVVYGLGVLDKDLIEDHKVAPAWLQCARPKAQKAMFATAWGSASNKAAERIYVAYRLVGHASWRSPFSVADLFPNGPDDPFVEFALRSRGHVKEDVLEALLKQIYFAA